MSTKPKQRRCSQCKQKLPIDAFGRTPYAQDCTQCKEDSKKRTHELLHSAFDGLVDLGYSANEIFNEVVNVLGGTE